MAQNDLGKRAGRKPAGKQPITQHPLFPVIVALWFGALFGLASVVVRPTLIEQVVLTLGVDKVIPMAAPPLGTTFRILLALGLAVVGGVIGLLLARRLARPTEPMQVRKRSATPARDESASISAHSMPVGETVSAMFASRNRGLTAAEPTAAAIAEPAPLPGGNPQILNVTEFDLEGFEQPLAETPLADEAEEPADPFETGNPFAAVEPAFEPVKDKAPVEAASTLEEPLVEEAPADYQPLNNRLFETYSREMAVRSAPAADQSAFAPSPVYAHVPEPGFDLLPLTDAEPVEEPGFAEAGPVAEAQDHFAEAWVDQQPVATSDDAEITAEPPHTAAERIAGADLDALSPVELLERLGLALERKRVEAAARAEAVIPAAFAESVSWGEPVADTWTAPEPEAQSEPVATEYSAPEFVVPEYTAPEYSAPEFQEPAPYQAYEPAPEFAPQDFTQPEPDFSQNNTGWNQPVFEEPSPEAPFAQPAAWDVPAALRPVALDEVADESDVLPGYVPPRHIGLSAAMPGDSDEGEGDEDEGSDDESVLANGYSSLLGLSRSAAQRQHFIPDDHAQPLGGDDSARPFAQPSDNGEITGPQPVAKPDPEDTERALRAALATLQRMSGAA